MALIINLTDRSPTINAETNAMMVGITGAFKIGCPEIKLSKISKAIDAKMIGTLIKNENLDASFLSAPLSKPATIVAPLLEIPGKTATP